MTINLRRIRFGLGPDLFSENSIRSGLKEEPGTGKNDAARGT